MRRSVRSNGRAKAGYYFFCGTDMSEKEGSSSDNGSGGDKQAVEKGGGERQEAPFSASQQAWLMELFEKAGSANQRQAPKLSEVDERTDGELE